VDVTNAGTPSGKSRTTDENEPKNFTEKPHRQGGKLPPKMTPDNQGSKSINETNLLVERRKNRKNRAHAGLPATKEETIVLGG